jgi:hypothetical protein
MTVIELRKEAIKTEGRKLLLNAFQFAFVDIIKFQTTDACSTSDLTNVKHNMNMHSRDELRCELDIATYCNENVYS